MAGERFEQARKSSLIALLITQKLHDRLYSVMECLGALEDDGEAMGRTPSSMSTIKIEFRHEPRKSSGTHSEANKKFPSLHNMLSCFTTVWSEDAEVAKVR